MFDPTDRPRVFALPPGADFGEELVRGILERLGESDPLALARLTIVVNTRRLERRLTDILQRDAPRLLPRIVPISELAEAFPAPSLSPQRPALRRKLDLMRLISALLEQRPALAPLAAAGPLADSMAELFDELQADGLDLAAIRSLDVEDTSEHWQTSVAFLSIAADYLANRADGLSDDAERQRLAVLSLLDHWKREPPSGPVIVAGSTGSRATTLALMTAVARLPQGALVLPGFDFVQPESVWEHLRSVPSSDDHPQTRYARMLLALDLGPKDVRSWRKVRQPSARNRLVSLALRPAPVTDAWRREGPSLGDLVAATDGVELIEATSPRHEAQAIALRLRAAIDEGRTAALISPDRMLTRQVAAALGRWGIEPDDSAGEPLSLSPPGRLLLHLDGMIGSPATARDLIVLLKHPLVAAEREARGPHLLWTRELELWLRGRSCLHPTPQDLIAWAASRKVGADAWVRWLGEALRRVSAAPPADFGKRLAALIELGEFLCGGYTDSGPDRLWESEAGRAATKAIGELHDAAPYAHELAVRDFEQILTAHLASKEVRDPVRPDPRVLIWGALEARVQSADLLVLGGLNEGNWPDPPDPGAWLSRPMRAALGLSSLERRVGLAAHDFQQAVASPEVVLSRAVKSDDAGTIPSRWLNRILNLANGLPDQRGKEAVAAMRARGRRWMDAADELDRRLPAERPESRPAPRPAPESRPKELSVTEVERLLRDPYAVYAKRTLRLRKLSSLNPVPDAALRGTVLHKVMERYLYESIDAAGEDAEAQLLAIAEDVFESQIPWPEVRRLWLARIRRVLPGFLTNEVQRRRFGHPYPPERRGEMRLADLDFVLKGTADRIDALGDGTLAVYDYKTGHIPSPKEVRLFDRQLLLEAVMAESGHFAEVPAGTVSHVGYISLNPSAEGRIIALPEDTLSTEQCIAEFRELIAAFQKRSRGFTSRRAVKNVTFEGDYDQLARFGEWDESDPPAPKDVGL